MPLMKCTLKQQMLFVKQPFDSAAPFPLRKRVRKGVILRHSNLSTTPRYLGKITDTEAMKWIENLYG